MIEARIKPADIAFIKPDLDATIKLSAYDYSIYGGLDAKLVHISADTIQDEEGESYYQIKLKATESTLKSNTGEDLPVIPGMTRLKANPT